MADVLVIGGGPAGAAAAIRLARAGRDVILLEREPGPHDKVCGEFLSGEALDDLSRLGLDLATSALSRSASCGCIAPAAQSRLTSPFPAASLSRRVLDEALLAARPMPAPRLCAGVRVTGLERHDTGLASARRRRRGPCRRPGAARDRQARPEGLETAGRRPAGPHRLQAALATGGAPAGDLGRARGALPLRRRLRAAWSRSRAVAPTSASWSDAAASPRSGRRWDGLLAAIQRAQPGPGRAAGWRGALHPKAAGHRRHPLRLRRARERGRVAAGRSGGGDPVLLRRRAVDRLA